jgi:hypothetical protein
MAVSNFGFWLAVAFHLLALIVGVYDAYAIWYLSEAETVSYWIRRWSHDAPALPLLVGFVMGHLFFLPPTR